MREDRCVICGEIIPEGYGHVCSACLNKQDRKQHAGKARFRRDGRNKKVRNYRDRMKQNREK